MYVISAFNQENVKAQFFSDTAIFPDTVKLGADVDLCSFGLSLKLDLWEILLIFIN